VPSEEEQRRISEVFSNHSLVIINLSSGKIGSNASLSFDSERGISEFEGIKLE